MSFQTPEKRTEHVSASRRQHEEVDCLVLRELNPLVVVDHIEGEQNTLTLLTFGNVREVCPKCQRSSLKLVLRQTSVRRAHLFCAECNSCYDAQYADGAPALTI
jgi:transposase-like protein